MSPYKALFLDIDGTIVKPDDTIDESTKTAITEVQKKGLTVVLATGRPLHEISPIAEELQVTSFIGYNGAYAIHNGEDVFKWTMTREDVQYFIITAQNKGHELVLYTHDKNLFTSPDSPRTKQFMDKLHLTKNETWSDAVLDEILGITVLTDSPNGSIHYQTGRIHLSQVNVEELYHCFDVIREDVNKGVGVTHFLRQLNLPAKTAIAFGDGMNDKEMLSSVGEGFAMGNAHPDLFAYAKHRTAEVTESGVYEGLRYLGLVD
ncbi:HAD family phosphatase [Bacillus sp. FJAT-42376]|uniref:HAD family hydrolase n=1 Tax=Bacillus sp. FJAT-42376 TaxID=2014076 RepID=UPI000F4E773B|nr:HAD family hydrolase [Bacillus sp. FJAT-42376]AZB44634.1 HAD family phosphatase [Bacillus sp. FJAT-42376]